MDRCLTCNIVCGEEFCSNECEETYYEAEYPEYSGLKIGVPSCPTCGKPVEVGNIYCSFVCCAEDCPERAPWDDDYDYDVMAE